MKLCRCITSVFSLACLWSSASEPSVWRIVQASTASGLIQASIDSAADGDTILVSPGTYYENINFHGKNICLKSISGPTSTILDGSAYKEPVVTCRSGETGRTIIQGFTLTGGFGHAETNNSSWGGGILCLNSQPQIVGNIIINNRAETSGFGAAWGGGLLVAGGSEAEPMLISGNVISGNYSSVNAGGIWLQAPCLFVGNEVSGNSTGEGDGAGMYIVGPTMEIRDNQFIENVAGDHGGGAYVKSAQAYFYGNVFIGNVANHSSLAQDCSGGAIWLSGYALFRNNTIAFNRSSPADNSGGGGICVYESAPGALIERNIIAFNDGGGIIASEFGTAGQTSIDSAHNLLFGNAPLDLLSSQQVVINENGDLFQDPLFCINGTGSDASVSIQSPALSQSFGVIGAIAQAGCGSVLTKRVTWGFLKSKY